ncbi:MAG: glycosyltransferase family 4 protein [Paludibacteraceae bacterium]|nr:glycosyltransferase family 4 protein [Paludibacteraceae bacterium]
MCTNPKKLVRAVTAAQSVVFFEPMIDDLQRKGYEIISVSSAGSQLDRLRGKGVRVIEVDMYRRFSPINDLKSLWRLIQVFREEKPYMVHSMTPKAGTLCMLAAWITRVPRRVHTFTGLVWPTSTGLSRKILMFSDWLTCMCATHVIPEGRGVLNDLRLHITRKPMRVLGYGNVRGVDLDHWQISNAPKDKVASIRNEALFTFVFVGRIVKDKGINELVVAFEKTHEVYPQTRLFLVGTFESDIDPISSITLDKIENSLAIEAVGPQYGNDLLAYYAASDCFVFPSYREGFPNTVLEAGAMGLPSIVTDINGSNEIIENGKNGIIVPSKDSESLFVAMKGMIEDEKQRQRMKSNARPMIASRFEQSYVKKCLLDFYDDISV